MSDNDDSFYDDFSGYEERSLTFDEVMEILEEELLLTLDHDNPYKPLNFNDTDEGYEE